jgi:hypothetical protein
MPAKSLENGAQGRSRTTDTRIFRRALSPENSVPSEAHGCLPPAELEAAGVAPEENSDYLNLPIRPIEQALQDLTDKLARLPLTSTARGPLITRIRQLESFLEGRDQL